MKLKTYLFVVGFVLSYIGYIGLNNQKANAKPIIKTEQTYKKKNEKLTERDLRKLPPTAENMHKVCKFYGIRHPEIVTAQAVLESGNFKSKVFKNKNNPFGLYNSKKGRYYSFPHWTSSVKGYKNMIQHRYKGGNYYAFLKKIRYAEDKNYISKVKKVHKELYM